MNDLTFGNNTVTLGQVPASGNTTPPLARLFIAARLERGPVNTPTTVSSLDRFASVFGTPDVNSPNYAAYRAARDYFRAVGRYGDLVVVRLYEGDDQLGVASEANIDTGAVPRLRVLAPSAGAYGDNLERRVTLTAAPQISSRVQVELVGSTETETVTYVLQVRERVGSTFKNRRQVRFTETRTRVAPATEWTYTKTIDAAQVAAAQVTLAGVAQLAFNPAGTVAFLDIEGEQATVPPPGNNETESSYATLAFTATALPELWLPFTGGDDSAAITPATLSGTLDEDTQERTGLYTLRDTTLGGGVVLTPGLSTFELNAARIQFAADTMRLTLVEPGEEITPLAAKADKLGYETLEGASYAAYVYPLAREARPTGAVSVSALGHVAGLIVANINREAGKLTPPAGITTIPDVQRAPNGRDYLVHDGNARDLQASGINPLVVRGTNVELTGLALIAPDPTQPATDKVHERLILNTIAYDVGQSLGTFNYAQVDAKGVYFGVLEGVIRNRVRPYHASGALYGATVDDAFRVAVDVQASDPAAISKTGRVLVDLKLKISPVAEGTTVSLYHVPLDAAF